MCSSFKLARFDFPSDLGRYLSCTRKRELQLIEERNRGHLDRFQRPFRRHSGVRFVRLFARFSTRKTRNSHDALDGEGVPSDICSMSYTSLIDPFGRHVTYLRVSVTDRCDFRCVYCMAEDMTFLPKKDL